MKRPTFIDVLIRSEPVRVFQMVLGGLLMLVAPIIGISTPGPFGIFVFAFGLALLLRNSRWARRRYIRYARRYPRMGKAVNFGLRRAALRKRRLARAALRSDNGNTAAS